MYTAIDNYYYYAIKDVITLSTRYIDHKIYDYIGEDYIYLRNLAKSIQRLKDYTCINIIQYRKTLLNKTNVDTLVLRIYNNRYYKQLLTNNKKFEEILCAINTIQDIINVELNRKMTLEKKESKSKKERKNKARKRRATTLET